MKRTGSSNSVLAPTAPAPGQLHKAEEIACYLRDQKAERPLSPGLSAGSLGKCLFFYAYTQLTGSDAFAKEAEETLVATVPRLLSEPPQGPLYVRELTEAGILISYLQERGYVDDSFDVVLAALDKRLSLALPRLIAARCFDPFTGYLAVAPYFLRRGSQVTGRNAALFSILDALLEGYEQAGAGGYWRANFLGRTHIYTGWSHGMAAILLFLAQVLESGLGYRTEEIKTCMAGAAGYLLQLADESQASTFPDIAEDTSQRGALNLCYGDLGIGYGLLRAGQALHHQGLAAQALAILSKAAGRRDLLECKILDASLIYGASGTALFFKKLHKETSLEAFGEAAAYWYEAAQALSRHPGHVAGFRSIYNQAKAHQPLSLFEGVTGYGAAILEYELGTYQLLEIIGY